jgi:hypothetical protein
MKRSTATLTCRCCGHQWSVTCGGYGASINTIRDYSRLLQEQQQRVCPSCGDCGHLPDSPLGAPNLPEVRLNPAAPEKSRTTRESPARPEENVSKTAQTSFVACPARFSLAKDVILPASSQLQIDEALVKIRNHHTIYQLWGFHEVDPMGKGVILNFYGQPGTGKTLTAEAMAGTLGMPFLALGMADVESKFMGETAQNIQKTFVASREQGALLFFDEADTLLGKRLSSVTQGVDNEVNALRSTLLMELERFEGIVVFATNFAENYDKAFENRITHHVRFDLPDLPGRTALWRKHLVPGIPLAEPREELIQRAAEQTEGMVGRDVRTCLRLALPKAMLEQERTGCAAALRWEHVAEAVAQVRRAHREVGQEVNPRPGAGSLQTTRSLLGLQQEP